MQHVATWKEGDEKWAYHADAFADMARHKVALDPYRLESRKILACIRGSLPPNLQKVEKAGIDEVFLDLSAQVHRILLERYPELALPAPHDDLSEHLPLPPTTVLDWKADALVDLDTHETENDDPDWDDVTMLIGSEIVREVRAAVRDQLKYTCSGGIAQNKMLSKLGSGHRKPNLQTVIRNRAIQQFLSGFKFTKIRNLGGKLGDQIAAAFNTDTVKELLDNSIGQLKQKLGEETGTWVYQIIRGIDHSEVNPSTQIKSMLSAKSFQPSINTQEQAARWLRIFVSDIYSRLVEEGELGNKRRPKTMNIHHRHGSQTKSRSAPIPPGRSIDETTLYELASKILGQIITEGNVWPCAHLSLTVSGFEDTVTGNMGIGSFLVKGEEAKAIRANEERAEHELSTRPEKRQRTQAGGASIHRFFSKRENTEEHGGLFGTQQPTDESGDRNNAESSTTGMHQNPDLSSLPAPRDLGQFPMTYNVCQRCGESFESDESLQSHSDWHYAKDLQEEDRMSSHGPQARTSPAPASAQVRKKSVAGKKSGNGGAGKVEKGQSKLRFG